MNKPSILITGSTGFIGSALVTYLDNLGYNIVAAVRKPATSLPDFVKQVPVGDLLPDTDWVEALSGIDTVIHLAARVHVMNDTHANPLEAFRKVNTIATLNLAHQAVASGVRRFIYLSSIKVNGENSLEGFPFKAKDPHIPTDPYGLSKYEAEEGLKNLVEKACMDVVIIRPPLVYGPNVKANFNSMMSWLYRGVPLPLGGITRNRRSLVALDNLIDLIAVCIEKSAAANETFLVSDDQDFSTTELLRCVAESLGKSPYLLPIPANIFMLTAKLLGRQDMALRLCQSLQVDISHTKDTLEWKPPISANEALQKTANAYLER